MIEAVDGRPYREYVREEVLDPLGMDRSTFARERFDAEDDAATVYRPGDGSPEPASLPFEELIHPSGGLVASVRDLSRWVRAAMGGEEEGSVAADGVFERCQRGRAVRQSYVDGSEQRYGYGCMRRPLAGDELVGNGGSVLVSTAYAGFLEDAGLGVAFACNTETDPHAVEVGPAVLAVANGADRTAEPAMALYEKCEAVTGTYESPGRGPTATVERESGGLSVTLDADEGGDPFVAFPASLDPEDLNFYTVTADGARVPVEFDTTGDRVDLFYTRFRFRRTGG